MRRQLNAAIQFLGSQKGRYLFVGGMNTVFNYVIGSAIYQALLLKFNFFVVAALVTFVTISISFTTQKLFVFRTQGKWWIEYLRSYIVYGSSAVLNIGLMWILLNRLHVNVWLAQALVTVIAVTISYIGHTGFTFRERKRPDKTSSVSTSPE